MTWSIRCQKFIQIGEQRLQWNYKRSNKKGQLGVKSLSKLEKKDCNEITKDQTSKMSKWWYYLMHFNNTQETNIIMLR